MSGDINRVVMTCRIAQEPELRRAPSGMAVLGLRVAVNDRRKDSQTGEWGEATNWVDVTMFGSRAESVSSYLHKGSKIGVDGKLRYSEWERDGQKRSKLEVVADDIEFLTPKGGGQGSAYDGVSPNVAYAAQQAQAASGYVGFDDIPFR